MKKNSLQIGIVGAGAITKNFHLPAWKKINGVKVTEIFDTDITKASKLANKYKIAKVSSSYNEMLQNKNLDIIAINTPNNLHFSQAIKALRFDKNVIVEKPFTTSSLDALKLKKIAIKKKLKIMCAQHQRFRPPSKVIQKLLKEKKIGEIYYAKAFAIETRNVPVHNNSFTSKKLGGGCLLDLGVHILDITWWMMGCPIPRSVVGQTFSKLAKNPNLNNKNGRWKNFDIDESAFGFIKFKNGAILSLETSYLLNSKKRSFGCKLFGTEGGLNWPKVSLINEKNAKMIKTVLQNENDALASVLQLKHFRDCVVNDVQPLITIDESITVIKMIEAIYESSKNKKEIKL